MDQLPENYQEIYRKHWSTIQESVKIWRFKDVYHFPLFGDEDVITIVSEVIDKYPHGIKLNVAFGFILCDRISDELKFFHPSNNSTMFSLPRQFMAPGDVQLLQEDLERIDILEYARTQRPSSNWTVEKNNLYEN